MAKPRWWDSSRMEVVVAVLIAIVSLTTAFSVWRTNDVGSNASDETRQGLIDAIKNQAFSNEDWRQTYEEADFAHNYAVTLAGANALQAGSDPADQAQAANLKKYLLPNLQLIAAPLAVDAKYALPDGTYDLQKRFADLRAADIQLDPEKSFRDSDRDFSQQRWLVVGSVLLAVSLFWLGLAQITASGRRLATMLIGLVFYGLGVVWFAGVELVFFFIRAGGA